MSIPKLIIGTYNHMPFGSKDDDIERAYQLAYRPFIASLYKYPSLPAALHFSGVLLEWFERRHPEFLIILEELVDRKQVELLGGAFYEPMLPLLPLSDRLGQIELLTTFLRKHFGKRPRGCWLPGCMWEPNLAGALQTSGMDYTFLDDGQFALTGLQGTDLERPCITEDQGKTVVVYPSSQRLGSLFASMDVGGILQVAQSKAEHPDRTLVALCDGLSFIKDKGPFDEAAFCSMLSTLVASEGFVEPTTPGRLLRSVRQRKKVFFPSGAEREVAYWSMDEARQRAFDALSAAEHERLCLFMGGGIPRQFLSRYPEANNIYSKMMYVHILINQLRGDKYRKRAAREELWKAQGCDGFWHIGSGGIYKNEVRKAVFRALIEAERITRERGVFIPSVLSVDFDFDGEREYLFQGTELNAYVHLVGGTLFELDFVAKSWNYLDTFTRRPEPYLGDEAIVDTYRRSAFVDHLLAPDISVSDFRDNRLKNSRTCALERYEDQKLDRVHHELVLRCPQNPGASFGSIEIQKTFTMKKNVLTVSYVLSNRGVDPVRFNFAPEINLSFASEGLDGHSLELVHSGSRSPQNLVAGELRGLDELLFHDTVNGSSICLKSAGPFDAFLLPLETRCVIEGALVSAYQGTCVVPIRPVVLAPDESWETNFSLKITD